jgi:hypothetical protein
LLKPQLDSNKPSSHSTEAIKVLLGSGASTTLLKASWLPKLKEIRSDNKLQWTMSAVAFETKYKAESQMIFIELHETHTITCEAHVAPE